MDIDRSTEFGARVARRLRDERIAWLTTVDPAGTPQPAPVWFLWDEESILVYSQPATAKLRNIDRNPRVSLNFDGDGNGGDIVVITGTARIDAAAPAAAAVPAYLDKYREGIRRIGTTPEAFARDYSVAVRIVPERLRGH